MRCPLCVDEALEPHVRNGVEVDRCPRCRGLWLDRGEIDKLVADLPTSAGRRSDEADRGERKRNERRRADWVDDVRVRRSSKKRKRKKGLGDRLADVLEELID